MTMPPGLRKLALTLHVATSVGWLGAVAAFLALAVAGLVSLDDLRVRGVWLAAEVFGWWVILPLALASSVTGIVQSLGTAWGLVRYWWVIAKAVITVPCTLLLLLHLQVIRAIGAAAADTSMSVHASRALGVQLTVDAGAALVVLIVATGFSVFKPRGLTRYGQRKLREERAATP